MEVAMAELVEFGAAGDQAVLAAVPQAPAGVVVLHEFFGLTPSFAAVCDAFAAVGWTALAPDLYDGRVARDVDEATALADGLDRERLTSRLADAFDAAAALTTTGRVGVVGFSLGAGCAGQLATLRPAAGTVLYYGLPWAEATELPGPVLGHFAEVDEWEPFSEVEAYFAALANHGTDATLHRYRGVGHWFANTDVPAAYDAAAADTARERTRAFLSRALG
jgi:carboxymethylenebutenolidase